jgi:cell division protein FtsB
MDFSVTGQPQAKTSFPRRPSLRSLVDQATAAEVSAKRTIAKLEPFLTQLYAVRRRVATGIVALLAIWLFVHVMFGANGMVIYRQKRAEYQSLQKEILSLETENDNSGKRINSLKTDAKTIEKEAREVLHYTRPGEIVYVSPAIASPVRASTSTASK